jgi:hypothetical protein
MHREQDHFQSIGISPARCRTANKIVRFENGASLLDVIPAIFRLSKVCRSRIILSLRSIRNVKNRLYGWCNDI